MNRSLSFAAAVSLLAACVTLETPVDPRGAVKPGQRMIVMVHQSPGPWIVADADSKAETALKLMPLGTFLQGMQEERINELSKELQPYLPRPRYDQAVEAALIKALKLAHGGQVQTAAEAGIAPLQRKDWNAAVDQLDWRRKYWFTDSGRPSPRDYSKLLSLDDAVIVEANLSFGLEPDEQDRTLPALSASSRMYRADTLKMLWSREDRLSDTTSSATLSEFRAVPSDLTDRLYALSAPLAAKIAAGLAKDAGLIPAPPPILAPPDATFINGSAPDISTAPLVSFSTSAAAPQTAPYPVPTPDTPPSWPPAEPAKPQTSFPSH